MADEILGTDLFGDPVLPRKEGRGRPEIQWDRSVSNKVLLAFARGLTVAKTAKMVGLSTPTLRKVYFSECAKRKEAADRLELTQLARLNDQAEQGSVAAEKELFKQLDRLRMRDQHVADAPRPAKTAAKPLGKKEQQQLAALAPSALYDAPPAPKLN